MAHSDIRRFGEERVDLPADIAKERRQKVNDLRDQPSKWMKDHPTCGIAKSYLSGSLAKSTALETSSDVRLQVHGQVRAVRS